MLLVCLCARTGYCTSARRLEAGGNLLWLSLASRCPHCFGRSSELHPLLLEDRVGGKRCTIAPPVSDQIMSGYDSPIKKNKMCLYELRFNYVFTFCFRQLHYVWFEISIILFLLDHMIKLHHYMWLLFWNRVDQTLNWSLLFVFLNLFRWRRENTWVRFYLFFHIAWHYRRQKCKI